VSLGIAFNTGCNDNADELMKYADIAMYRAKKLGRNQACYFEQSMQLQFLRHFDVDSKLRKALKQNAFMLYYQPVFDPSNKQLLEFEALIRLVIDDEQLFPDEFIPIAEESLLIIDIGRWVIEQAIKQLSQWQSDSRYLTMGINLSVIQLADTELVSFIEHCLTKYQVPANKVEWELTETALLKDTKQNIMTINSIKSLGCRIALDDFGTGFSSIAHLQDYPIDTVKIDKSLIFDFKNEKTSALIRGLSQMLKSLGLGIVAEGVEYKKQLELCAELKIDRVQGYYFSKPLAVTQIKQQFLHVTKDKTAII